MRHSVEIPATEDSMSMEKLKKAEGVLILLALLVLLVVALFRQ
jgi:hypothetical protein